MCFVLRIAVWGPFSGRCIILGSHRMLTPLEGVGYHNPPLPRVTLSKYSGIASAGMSVGEANVMGNDGDTYLVASPSNYHKRSDDSPGSTWNKSCVACSRSKRKCDGLFPCRLVYGQVDE